MPSLVKTYCAQAQPPAHQTRRRMRAHVVVQPRELRLDVALGVEGLAELDDLEVGHVELHVLGQVEVLLRDQDALCAVRQLFVPLRR